MKRLFGASVSLSRNWEKGEGYQFNINFANSFCSGKVKSDKVELVYQYRGKLYIFQNVPTGVCQQCGEKYLTAKVAKEIEQRILTKEKWDKTISIPVDVFPEEIAV
jgi:YgiT-type zinc finger domain-containing protein